MSLSYPRFSTTFFVPRTPNGVVDLAIRVTQGGPQQITATPGMGSGTPGVPGTVVVMTALHAAMGVDASMFRVGANTLVRVPLSVGRAGQVTGTFTVIGVLHLLTVDFYAWTPGTLTFTGLTLAGAPLPNVTAAGSFGVTSLGGGTLALVSPSKISIDTFSGNLGQRRTVSFSRLELSFVGGGPVPEPGTWLLLAGGAWALASFARRGRR